MPLSPDMVSMINDARSFVDRADGLSAPLCGSNAASILRNLRAFVAPTCKTDSLFDAAERACLKLRDVDSWNRQRLADAQDAARAALDRLSPVIEQADPNSHARALGLG